MTNRTADSASPSFALPVRVYWEDTDAGGIVYHASYLRFMERARNEWLHATGIYPYQMLREFCPCPACTAPTQ